MKKRKVWKAILLTAGLAGLFGSSGCNSGKPQDNSAGQSGATENHSSGSVMQNQKGAATTQKRNPDM